MSRFNELPLDTPTASAVTDHSPYPEGRPLSKAAVTGFVSALLILPIVPQLLGLLFGAIGIYTTRERRLRGRGMAIVAIAISLLVGAAWIGVFSFGLSVFRSIRASDGQVLTALRASADDQARLMETLYDERMTAGLKQRLSRAQFVQWATGLRTKHGQLLSARLEAKKPVRQLPDGALEMNYVGEFINGRAALAIRYDSILVDPIKIDGLSVDGIGPTAD